MLAILVLVAALVVIVTTSVLKNVSMSGNTKNLIATGVSLVVGLLTAFVEAGSVEALTAGGVLTTVGLVYAAGQVAYKFILKPSGFDEVLETKVNG